ncbi:hypothetical protein [Pseudobacteriovorax antillogorgiicola]|uniref:TRAP transporter T-component n=1 Tax=Pseudobacteriovorax antillogorgiicola TaxID=1513793 RepID=A0A1Y6BL02_9BACT|nr:hypothetical protein [Pseudobacteriovorax antillogorgiicola]TCS56249.1 hypothetical protein EDD56_10471 [Pseudobacteriovorax antillogorgiicola]SMF08025.1 hypothetical protein SAMN06296036_104262 [Pseudobacteriovorax antillogorgiicola]
MHIVSNFCRVLVAVFILPISAQALDSYEVNTKPLFKYPSLAKEFQRLHDKFQKVPLTIKEHEQRIDILETVLEKEGKWLDGYWLHGSESFILASSYSSEDDFPIARNILANGLQKVETCLEIKGDHLLCRFFQGSLLAKISSIDGIFASLRHGKTIHDAFFAVTRSSYNMQFRPNVSLIGAAYYGLGLFYRLVPDVFLVDWFWGIRGNLSKSIALHKKAISYDDNNPCSLLMLSVALFCKYHSDNDHPEYKAAVKHLKTAQGITPIDKPQEVCVKETYKIEKQTDRTCGYTQAKYQEEVKE